MARAGYSDNELGTSRRSLLFIRRCNYRLLDHKARSRPEHNRTQRRSSCWKERNDIMPRYMDERSRGSDALCASRAARTAASRQNCWFNLHSSSINFPRQRPLLQVLRAFRDKRAANNWESSKFVRDSL